MERSAVLRKAPWCVAAARSRRCTREKRTHGTGSGSSRRGSSTLGDRVVVFQREYQRGRSSGLELVVETAAVVDLRSDRVVRIQGYMDRAAALKAVGLSEEEAYSSP